MCYQCVKLEVVKADITGGRKGKEDRNSEIRITGEALEHTNT